MAEVDAAWVHVDFDIDFETVDAFVYYWILENDGILQRDSSTTGSCLYRVIWNEKYSGYFDTPTEMGIVDRFTVRKLAHRTRLVFLMQDSLYDWQVRMVNELIQETTPAQKTTSGAQALIEIQGRRGRPKERTFEENLQIAYEYISSQNSITQKAFCDKKTIGISTLKSILDDPMILDELKKRYNLAYSRKKRQV